MTQICAQRADVIPHQAVALQGISATSLIMMTKISHQLRNLIVALFPVCWILMTSTIAHHLPSLSNTGTPCRITW
ncbi:hypothetical protein K503DRAFT_115402 [Rhizopogon vinicolor AM-OR11-026]|uniref:Uncharacterized protein n=1 Tax=Rhizopogon vinicolor AM-OR11-026 TaxID=1314800 RepID=A0A1B7MEX4_9AGAM|nr:hypothetical protein K503DRAFT_115402 [Rhizopogon vinicolor AM-OR11-026]